MRYLAVDADGIWYSDDAGLSPHTRFQTVAIDTWSICWHETAADHQCRSTSFEWTRHNSVEPSFHFTPFRSKSYELLCSWFSSEQEQHTALTLFRDTLDETSHCGRYPAIVQSRVHSMINLWFRPRKAVMSRLKRAEEWKTSSGKMTPSSSFLASIAHIGWL